MTGSSFANVLDRRFAPRERTEQPVWRGSYDVDDPRAQVAFPFEGRKRSEMYTFISWFVIGLKTYKNETKKPGRSHTITNNMIDVAETLMRRCTDPKTGICCPSIETIMEKTGFARPTVISLLAKLRKYVGIDWVRRTVRTDEPSLRGGQIVAQTSNAYFLDLAKLPLRLSMYLRQKLKGMFDFDRLPQHKGSPLLPSFRERRAGRLVAKATGGSWAGGSKPSTMRRQHQARISAARTPIERARAMWPDDPEAQRFYLAAQDGRFEEAEGEFRTPTSMGDERKNQKE